MRNQDAPAQTVTIGGRQIPLLIAALIAQEADRRHVPPSEVGDVPIYSPIPTHVELAGKRLSVRAAAYIAAAADAQGIQPRRFMEAIVEAHCARLIGRRRARRRARRGR